MSRGAKALATALASVPVAAFQRKLARVVALDGLEKINPHDWLYSTRRPYRYNLAGAECVYFSETREVAQTEYDSYWQGLPGEFQPLATYHAEVSLRRVLDLTDPSVLAQLKIQRRHLFLPWRTAKRPVLTQRLGAAVLATKLFGAIRYPSRAAEALGRSGTNFVLFRAGIQAPDFVHILGPNDRTLQQWP